MKNFEVVYSFTGVVKINAENEDEAIESLECLLAEDIVNDFVIDGITNSTVLYANEVIE